MAKLDPKPYTFEPPAGMGRFDAEDAELKRLMAEADKLPEGEVKGIVLRFHVADGHAMYLVTKARPLTLQHLAFFDGYSIPAAHVRGLDAQDVLAQERREKQWRRLTAKSEA